ncbi:MAG: hypothetical protein ACC656_02820 [Candidatus Heimdallarchaeota archaeon]
MSEETKKVEQPKVEIKVPPKKRGGWMNKHKIPGKHRLKYDSIFKGKKQEPDDEIEDNSRNDGFEIDRSSSEWQSKYDFEEYNRLKQLKQHIYEIIIHKTDINLKANRRKPGRLDFNRYYNMLIANLDMRIFSHSEVFIELSYYFSENEYNMFKLLDQQWGTKIVKELSTKYNVNKIDGVDFI